MSWRNIARRLAVALAVVVGGMALLPAGSASAYTVCDKVTGGQQSSACSTGGDDPVAGQNGVLNKVISILSIVGGIIAVIMISIGAIRFITSGGDPSAVSSAKNTIIYAAIGLVVIVLSRVIIGVIIGKL